MKNLWLERLFNLFKLKQRLLIADAWLTIAFVLWAGYTGVISVLYALDPARFPISNYGYWVSLSSFFIYYAVVGFIRRQADRNYITLCADYPDSTCGNGKIFKNKKPYDEKDDPPAAQLAFKMREWFPIIPRRGAAQAYIVIWQFVIGFCYIMNYSWYVLYRKDLSGANEPTLLYLAQTTMTGGGLLILLKNAGFLFDTKKLLEFISGIAETILGHGASIKISPPSEDSTHSSKKE
jgi:hypothetical protein